MMAAASAISPHLKRVVLVRADVAHAQGDPSDPALAAGVAARVRALRRQWEWAEEVAASPRRCARSAARQLAPHGPIALLTQLGPRGHRETLADFEARVAQGLARLAAGPAASVLVVAGGEVIRQAVAALTGDALPEGRPEPGEMAVVTRDVGGDFRLGRRSSDPPPLRSPLEREGLSGPPEARRNEQHVAKLELALVAE